MPFTDAELIEWLPTIMKFTKMVTRGFEYEDVYSSVVLRLLEKRHLVHHDQLYTIVQNESVSRHRKWDRMVPTDPIDLDVPDIRIDVIERIYYAEICSQIDGLTHNHHQILVLAADGSSYEEIAARLQIPEGTVRSRLTRARTALRDRVQ